jgi:hypothetical protein
MTHDMELSTDEMSADIKKNGRFEVLIETETIIYTYLQILRTCRHNYNAKNTMNIY